MFIFHLLLCLSSAVEHWGLSVWCNLLLFCFTASFRNYEYYYIINVCATILINPTFLILFSCIMLHKTMWCRNIWIWPIIALRCYIVIRARVTKVTRHQLLEILVIIFSSFVLYLLAEDLFWFNNQYYFSEDQTKCMQLSAIGWSWWLFFYLKYIGYIK